MSTRPRTEVKWFSKEPVASIKIEGSDLGYLAIKPRDYEGDGSIHVSSAAMLEIIINTVKRQSDRAGDD